MTMNTINDRNLKEVNGGYIYCGRGSEYGEYGQEHGWFEVIDDWTGELLNVYWDEKLAEQVAGDEYGLAINYISAEQLDRLRKTGNI